MIHVKTVIVLLVAIASVCDASAKVVFKFETGTIDAGPLKTKMEKNITDLLTELHRAGEYGTVLNLTGVNMELEAKARLNALWNEAAHFVCDRQTNVSKCLNDYQGYQVRSIPITMKPVNDAYDGALSRELTISLDKNGVITGVRPAWEIQEDVSKIMSGTGGVADTRQRREILKWVEDFRCYYNERNIKALDLIYNLSSG